LGSSVSGGIEIDADATTATIKVYDNTGCSGVAQTLGPLTNGVCVKLQGVVADWRLSWVDSSNGGGSGPCFHSDTIITYKDQQYTQAQLLKHPECRIPHIVKTVDGVQIKTDCGHTLRLTNDHLVFSQDGLVTAVSLKPGSLVFTSLSDKSKLCRVTSVVAEAQSQEYFGLNCLESIVLANGLKTSTFGRYHIVPSWWMRIAGRMIGIKRASSIGDRIAAALYKLRAI